MSDELVVRGAQASLSPSIPTLSIDVTSHVLSLVTSGPFATSASSEVLVQADVEMSFSTYVTPYKTAAFPTPGALKFKALKSVSQLSGLIVKKGAAVVTKRTHGVITCTVVPAQSTSSPPVPDPAPSYELEFTISDAGQTLARSD
jgi:hypothetical protein